MSDIPRARQEMVDVIARRGVADAGVLAAMRQVPREAFVAAGDEGRAHEDAPLPIGEGQTISQPYIVALMMEAAKIRPGERVLEIGAGSGYAAAVMSRVAASVHAVERLAGLARRAAQRLASLGYDNVAVLTGDGTLGWPKAAPYDAIVVSAGAPAVPEALKRQLAVGGRLVLPVGSRSVQQLLRVTRRGEDDFHEEALGDVRFVPLVGRQGWSGEESPAGA